jgi:hypothetical protein
MRELTRCDIDGVSAYDVSINSVGSVSAEVGFTLKGRRFGMAKLSGLEDYPEVADLSRRLLEAIESVVADQMGTQGSDLPQHTEYLGSGEGI